MRIKSLLLGSAAALAVVSGAHAADAIVAAEPEAVEYVRVCDAYGTGYFYIPGTETCLKIDGYVRFEADFARGVAGGFGNGSDYDAFTRAQLQFTAKSDTEYGVLTGLIALRTNADSASNRGTFIDVAYLDIAGLRAGYFYSWWDDGLSGETDDLASHSTNHNSIRYQYESGDFYAGISVDELEGTTYGGGVGTRTNNLGVAGAVGGKASGFTYQVTGGYDTDTEEGAVRGMITADLGPGTLGLAGVWASGANAYYDNSEWAVAAEYAIKVTDKWKITPAAQYYGHYGLVSKGDFSDDNAWKAGVTLDYQIVDNFYAKATVNYKKVENSEGQTTGYFRLQRSF
ncbi:porin [Oryzifoliimicrobium ureilyticus]|uniref:porin n=1 Tax=Oryzifoliimicrobium ureilyticus TaxID=3113724 RepID=UPI0030764ED4